MNTAFGFSRYGTHVGVGSVTKWDPAKLAAIDTRALSLNTGIGSWIAALGTSARPIDTAFAASWADYYRDWRKYHLVMSSLPAELEVDDRTTKPLTDWQNGMYVWESRFDVQKRGGDAMTPPGGAWTFPTWAWIPVIGGVAYGVWRFFLKGHWR